MPLPLLVAQSALLGHHLYEESAVCICRRNLAEHCEGDESKDLNKTFKTSIKLVSHFNKRCNSLSLLHKVTF